MVLVISAANRTKFLFGCARRRMLQHSAERGIVPFTTNRLNHFGSNRSFSASSNNKDTVGSGTGSDELVYESPLGNLVSRLRGVSLATGVIGSLGLPLVVFIKGGDLPSTGMLAIGMAFVTGSLGSTAAIHFVFSPYVFTIERIPIRLCGYKKKVEQTELQEQGGETSADNSANDQVRNGKTQIKPPKDVLYKATSKSLFLTRIETVFDPALDLTPYKGLRPLCNFIAKGKPLYVHPEYLYNEELRRAMKLDTKTFKAVKENPDDFF